MNGFRILLPLRHHFNSHSIFFQNTPYFGILILSRTHITPMIRFKTKEEGYITEYDFKYLGSLKIKRDNFKVIQRTILSGLLPEALRANVSLRLFLKGKLYGEYTEFDMLHKIKVVSNTLCLYDNRTKTKAFFKLKDSIPNNLYFPHEENDSGLIGEMFYFSKCP